MWHKVLPVKPRAMIGGDVVKANCGVEIFCVELVIFGLGQ